MQNSKIYDMRMLAHIVLAAETPLAIGSGEKTELTDAAVLKDVNGLPYIPGSTIAGILSHSISPAVKGDFFGVSDFQTYGERQSKGSDIIFSEGMLLDENGRAVKAYDDCETDFLSRFKSLPKRNHVCITSRGVAKEHGKFDREVVYRGSRFAFDIEMVAESSEKERAEALFVSVLDEISSSSFRIGGGTRNGFGKVNVVQISRLTLNLRNPDELSEYLSYSSSLSGDYGKWDSFKVSDNVSGWIKYDIKLSPVDFFSFGSGYGDKEVDDIPVSEDCIEWKNGKGVFASKKKLLIPATSLKGAISHRVAFYGNVEERKYAMDIPIEDFDLYSRNENRATALLFGYHGESTLSEKQDQRGLCVFSDIFVDYPQEKVFNHVKIDRFTGGSMDGALYSEKAIDGRGLTFTTFVLIQKSDDEYFNMAVDCFEKALADIDAGTLTLGGKSGRGHGTFRCKYEKTIL